MPGSSRLVIPLRFFNNQQAARRIMTNKLDVGKALENLRGKDEPKSRMTILDEKTKAADEELRRLKAERQRLERQNPGPTNRN
jgi:hypothetical protein